MAFGIKNFSKVWLLAVGALSFGFITPTYATIIGGVDFPEGIVSFADATTGYSPGTGNIDTAYGNPDNAVGTPDFVFGTSTFVSLGDGGSLTLQFIDNALTGSGDSDLDLWIFEVGPAVEPTEVEISKDGNNWFSIGNVGGATAGVDLDSFGYGENDYFYFVRLTDVSGDFNDNGSSPGADIDAVGAISTVLASSVSVPVPGTLGLLGLALVGLGLFARRGRGAAKS